MTHFTNDTPVERHRKTAGVAVSRPARSTAGATAAAVTVLLLAIVVSGCTVSSNDDREPGSISNGTGPTIGKPEGGTIDGPVGGKIAGKDKEAETTMSEGNPTKTPGEKGKEVATFGAGCFWCVEAVLEQLDGVSDVSSGYMGGAVENPTYEEICTGTTGHAEVVQVVFDPDVISYDKLLVWFWKLHDPTTLNRQGADSGPQYRSVIFYHSEAQRVAAEASKKKADASGAFSNPIVTEITAASPYYVAESKHQDFYRGNRKYGYCRAVIAPKLDKLGLEK